jgi:hypothetical protein
MLAQMSDRFHFSSKTNVMTGTCERQSRELPTLTPCFLGSFRRRCTVFGDRITNRDRSKCFKCHEAGLGRARKGQRQALCGDL